MLKEQLKKIQIGYVTNYYKAYKRKALNRLYFDENNYCKEATPFIIRNIGEPLYGFIIGIRSVLMTEVIYKPAAAHISLEDSDYVSGYMKGKRETVLLVTKNIRQEPFIVRLCDCA